MKYSFLAITGVTLLLFACDKTRVYEKNYDFDKRIWLVDDQPVFDFSIDDTTQEYNLYCNLRNSIDYPYTRIFITFTLTDSLGNKISSKLLSEDLFDKKTGEPFGNSALGDLYDQQFALLQNFKFGHEGIYKLKFEQFMRRDSLDGVLAIGLRVEKILKN